VVYDARYILAPQCVILKKIEKDARPGLEEVGLVAAHGGFGRASHACHGRDAQYDRKKQQVMVHCHLLIPLSKTCVGRMRSEVAHSNLAARIRKRPDALRRELVFRVSLDMECILSWLLRLYRGTGMHRKLLAYAAGATVAASAAFFFFSSPWVTCGWRALALVTAYTAVLVAIKYPPGRCMHRISVVTNPDGRLPVEVLKARDFLTYVCTRLLFAGLIFTLFDAAVTLLANKDLLVAADALRMALLASLFSLMLYLVVSRAGRQVLSMAAEVEKG
jgi:hypothetical protein